MITVNHDKSGFAPKEDGTPKAKEETKRGSIKDLRAAAKSLGVSGYSKMKRKDLEKAISSV
tara:strand:- start:290 stop:472 length:183 start_codon:yes stop_codon:yes gene_type:complete